MEEHTKEIKHAVVVGGGLIGIETVEMLLSRNIAVTFLIREKSFWDAILPKKESEMINKLIIHHKVDLQLETELKEIKSIDGKKVTSIMTSKGQEISCGFVALTVGVSPNISFVKDSGIETDRGVLIDSNFRTNVENIFSVGDCAQFKTPVTGRKPIEQVWYTGKMHGETAAKNIVGIHTPYQPGHWFNSAKFFDLEYQTYGLVLAQKGENEEWFWWQDKKGEKGMRIMWDKNTLAFKGLNSFGIRVRHEICNNWLNDKTNVKTTIKELQKANFDPEFFKGFEKEFAQAFNHQNTLIEN